jgi:hypothetical protein
VGESFDVKVDAIEAFSKTSDKRGDLFEKIVTTLEEAKVGREAFGKMPSSGDIFAQYEERVSSSIDDLKSCVEVMRDISASLADTVLDYTGVDQGIADIMKQVMDGLGQTSVPQVGGK